MSEYNVDSSGKYFLKDGEIYQCVGFCPDPSLIFENVRTREKEQWSIHSDIVTGFKELVEKKEGE